jgi:hypothetical protein
LGILRRARLKTVPQGDREMQSAIKELIKRAEAGTNQGEPTGNYRCNRMRWTSPGGLRKAAEDSRTPRR